MDTLMFCRRASYRRPLLLGLTLAAAIGSAATLEQLSEDRLIDESTQIVRGTVSYCNYTFRQPMIWTVCEVNVTETFKGASAAKVQVAIPGGTAAGFRQSFEGAPKLNRNSEYLFFLWEGKSGLKQIMGLSQGLLSIVRDANGNLTVVRAKSAEQMVNSAGQTVEDTAVSMPLSDMRRSISSRRDIRPSTGARK